MFRKCFAAIIASMLVAGGLFAEDIKAVFKKFEDGKVTVTVDDKEKTYKVDPDVTFKFKTKGGDEKEVKLVDSLSKRYKEGDKVTLTLKDDVVVGAKREFMKKKKTDN